MTRKHEVPSSNFQRRPISRHSKKIVNHLRPDIQGEELIAAIKLLTSVAGFSDVRCRVYAETEPVLDAMRTSPVPRLQAFSWFDAHAHSYAGLINNADLRDAYLIILNQLLFPVAYISLFGLPNLVPATAEGLELLARLEKKLRGWQHEAFSRTRTDSPALPTTGTTADSGTAPRAVNWEDIEIHFVSDERVQITTSNQTETRNYTEMGFEDGRSGKPNRAWLTLRILAQLCGTMSNGAKAGQDWSRVEKRIQKIREVLRSHFGISANPLPYVEGTGYRAIFKISCAPSYET